MAQLKDLIVNGVSRFLGNVVAGVVKATSFVKDGGTSSQFLKADGSVDSNTYAKPGEVPVAPGAGSTSVINKNSGSTASGSGSIALGSNV